MCRPDRDFSVMAHCTFAHECRAALSGQQERYAGTRAPVDLKNATDQKQKLDEIWTSERPET
jgi:hypothetical protein